jgi:glutamine amidotransferase
MSIVIIDYGSGNLRSVAKAFEHVGADVKIISDAQSIKTANHIVLPGVGAFADCMAGLQALDGVIEAISEAVLAKKTNFLGICVGMQMLFERGFEYGEHQGLCWLSGDVVKLSPSNSSLKIPHMGWNNLAIRNSHSILRGIENGAHAYFVHSYHANAQSKNICATTDYGQAVTAVVADEHIVGVQFHPEKSQALGLAILKNFMDM